MNGIGGRRVTVYSSYVFSNVLSILGAGQGAYDINALAAACGLKPTHSFRSRVNDMVASGLIVAVPAYTEKGGMIAVYHLPVAETKEMPF